MAAKFEIYQDKKEEYRFRLKAGNGEIVGTSGEGYSSKSACENGTDSVRRNAAKAEVVAAGEGKCPKFEVYEDKGGSFRFRLIASNGEPILASQGYASKSGAEDGCGAVARAAESAETIFVED